MEEEDRRQRSHYSLLERRGKEENKYPLGETLTTMHSINCQSILVNMP
jgi:hypothetical protein